MKRLLWLLWLLPLLLLSALPAHAFPTYYLATARGWCEAGAQVVVTSGLQSTTLAQASYPACTITVAVHGGGIVPIYSTGTGGALSNPFTANSNGQWMFYAVNGNYDITLSGGGLASPVVYSDVSIVSVIGSISCTGLVNQVVVSNGSNACSGSALLTQGDGTNALGLFNGVPTSSLSSNLGQFTGVGVLPEIQANRWVKSSDSDTTAIGLSVLTQLDKDIDSSSILFATDATNAKTGTIYGANFETFINVPNTFTNSDDNSGIFSYADAYGAGTASNEISAFSSEAVNTGTGTVGTLSGYTDAILFNSGGGTVNNAFGFHALDVTGIGGTLNAAFKADAQTAGAHNWGFYSDVSNIDHFGKVLDVTTQLTKGTFSALPACAAGTEGMMGAVTDSTTAAWGATITGTGANHVLAYCDGTNWTVAGK